MELIEVLEKGYDNQMSEDLPSVINRSAVRNLLKSISGKRVSTEVIEALNLVLNTIIEDVGGSSATMPGKTITLEELKLILGLRQDININIGSFHVKRVSNRASKRMVQYMVRQAMKEVTDATEKGELHSLLDKYDILDEDELEDDEDDQ